MLKDVDVDSLVKKDFDCATILDSKYVPPSVPDYKGVVEEGLKIYNGSCHCGAVSYTVKSKPLEEMEITSCNCSLCSRVRHNPGYLPITPNRNCREAIYSSTPFPWTFRFMAQRI
jgi:hypothetical protein